MAWVLRALLIKELRQHGGALGLGTGLLGLAWVVAQVSLAKEARTLSVLQLVSGFAIFPLVAASLWLGHRLVVTEYYGRTQRFVEALPIARGGMALAKAIFGLGVLELWALFALAAGAWQAAASEPIGARFLAIMAARLGLFVFALWGVVFLLGFFGRLRLPLAAGLAAVVLLLDRTTTWSMQRFGPLALIAPQTFGFERQHFPARALVEAAAVGVLGFAGGWALARLREGSIVEALARPLATRELAALLVVGLGAVLAFVGLEAERPPRPFQLSTDKAIRRQDAPLQLGYFEDELRPAAVRLGDELGPRLVAFRQALGWPEALPPIHLVHAPDADPGDPETELMHHEQGLAVAVNLRSGAERPVEVAAYLLHQLIWARTRGRAGVEPRHWLLDGFTYHFALFGLSPSAPPLLDEPEHPWLLRALAAHATVPLSARTLAEYHSTAERLGDPVANALAASGWWILEARIGRKRVLELARVAFGRRGTGDLRDYLHDRRHPLLPLFAEVTGLRWEAFLADWAETLTRLARHPAAAARLAALPRGRLQVSMDRVMGRIWVGGSLQTPPAEGTICSLYRQRLWAHDVELATQDLERFRFVMTGKVDDLVQATEAFYGSGERVFVALDCEPPPPGFAVRLLSARVTVP
jgi:hypothetical protein